MSRQYIASIGLVAALATVTVVSAQEAPAPETPSEPGVVTKVEKAVVHAARATANGVERGAHAAAKGVKRGAEAVGHVVERGANATGNAAKKVVKKIKGGDEPASAPAPEDGK